MDSFPGNRANREPQAEAAQQRPRRWTNAQEFANALRIMHYRKSGNTFEALRAMTPEPDTDFRNVLQRIESENGLTREEYVRLVRFLLVLLDKSQYDLAKEIIHSMLGNPENIFDEVEVSDQDEDL